MLTDSVNMEHMKNANDDIDCELGILQSFTSSGTDEVNIHGP